MKLTGSIIHAGREHHAGDTVPDGADLERLERLGLLEKPAAAKPAGKRPRKPQEG